VGRSQLHKPLNQEKTPKEINAVTKWVSSDPEMGGIGTVATRKLAFHISIIATKPES